MTTFTLAIGSMTMPGFGSYLKCRFLAHLSRYCPKSGTYECVIIKPFIYFILFFFSGVCVIVFLALFNGADGYLCR